MRVVLDTNVIVSSVLNKYGYSAQIRSLWQNGSIHIATSEPILEEVERVLNYPHIQKRHNWTPQQIAHFVDDLRARTMVALGNMPVDAVKKDPDDNKFFACAVETHADYLISGDERHVLPVGAYKGIPVISPRDFIEKLRRLKKAA